MHLFGIFDKEIKIYRKFYNFMGILAKDINHRAWYTL